MFLSLPHLKEQQYGLAVVDLTPLAKEVRTSIGAEAKYLLADAYFHLGSIDLAEQEVMSFIQMQTSQQYWLAKSLILLADINIQRNDIFQVAVLGVGIFHGPVDEGHVRAGHHALNGFLHG